MTEQSELDEDPTPRLPNNLAGRVRKTWDDYDLDDIKELGKRSW